jgi:chromate reductase, NAD(P)H dehydrogenase (quinone)
MQQKKILAISGSLRENSSNTNLLKWIGRLIPAEFSYTLYQRLGDLPHFNPSLDGQEEPEPVRAFKALLREADGVIVCTPEYAFGVPGTLKNAFDWTVFTDDFGNKPVALITASSSGAKAHESMLNTLRALHANVSDAGTLLISFIRTKINEQGEVTDENTRKLLEDAAHSFVDFINKNAAPAQSA